MDNFEIVVTMLAWAMSMWMSYKIGFFRGTAGSAGVIKLLIGGGILDAEEMNTFMQNHFDEKGAGR